jgi:very-short-patch-repair endonuclease
MKNKYGLIKKCLFCGNEFETRPHFNLYCSQACKNPNNRPGHIPWNKGLQMSEEFKQTKMNLEGLAKGWGWNKGVPNDRQKSKWTGEGNPNWNGGISRKRQRTGSLSHPGKTNGMWNKKHTAEVKEICRQAKIKNMKDGVYASSVSRGENKLLEKLREKFGEVIHQFTVPNYHRVYDMYIPSLNLIVEYDGDYWHREEKYLPKDSRDTAKAIKRGFKIFRYWESTVKEQGFDNIVEDIVKLKGKYCRILTEA